MLRENLSRQRLYPGILPGDADEFDDHWSRLCEMDWEIFQELPRDVKQRLEKEWEFDLDPVRYAS